MVMPKHERGLIKLLMKLGIKSAEQKYKMSRILRMNFFSNQRIDVAKLADLAEGEPETIP